MANFRFFVEGKADAKFIKDLIEEHFGLVLDLRTDFIELGGWSGYKKEANRFIESTLLGNTNIVVMDNDEKERRAEVEKDFVDLNIKGELFLMPDDRRIGELETLLSDIAVKRDIIKCFDQYKECIRQYNPIDEKDKIYAYLDALLSQKDKKKLIKDENRDFRNKEHWDLHHESLNPLLEFLTKHLKP